MKKATLVGLVGVIIITLLQVFYLIRNLTEDYSIPAEYIIQNIIGLAGWCGISYFFIELYKRQK